MLFNCAFGELSIFLSLLVIERAGQFGFKLRGKFGGHFALYASENERGNLSAEKLGGFFGGFDQVSFQILTTAKQSGHEEPENGPQIEGRVLNRSSRERETMTGVYGEASLGHFRLRVLDQLRFVEYGVAKVHGLEKISMPAQLGVARHP